MFLFDLMLIVVEGATIVSLVGFGTELDDVVVVG